MVIRAKDGGSVLTPAALAEARALVSWDPFQRGAGADPRHQPIHLPLTPNPAHIKSQIQHDKILAMTGVDESDGTAVTYDSRCLLSGDQCVRATVFDTTFVLSSYPTVASIAAITSADLLTAVTMDRSSLGIVIGGMTTDNGGAVTGASAIRSWYFLTPAPEVEGAGKLFGSSSKELSQIMVSSTYIYTSVGACMMRVDQ